MIGESSWVPVCSRDRLSVDRGVAARVDDREVAIFRLANGDLHAIDNVDPCCGVGVLSRGVVGDRGGRVKVASPMYKQSFSLETGECLDDPGVRVSVHGVREIDGVIEVRIGS